MKNLKMKFKKIESGELYVESGHATDRHFILNAVWIAEFCQCKNLKANVAATQLITVSARVRGETVREIGVSNVLEVLDLSEFRAVNIKEAKPVYGLDSKFTKKLVGFKVGSTNVNLEYFPALVWDSETNIMVRGAADPVVITKNGAVVGMIAAMLVNK